MPTILSRRKYSRRRAAIYTSMTVIVGVIVVVAIFASGSPIAFEAESGGLTSPARTVTPSGASAGSAVQFGSSTSPSGEAMPVGDLSGWKQTGTQDFNTAAPIGSFQTTYTGAKNWCGYSESAKYSNNEVLSAHDGMMDFNLDGTKGGAGYFVSNGICGSGNGQVYGRFSIRFKVVGASGYGTAMMVWPSSDVWGDGEIDYPEGNFNGTFSINQHPTNCTNCGAAFLSQDTHATFTSWHTATTEWTSAGVKYYLDGTLIATTTTNVPVNNHRMTVQMAPTSTPAVSGHFLIDWIAIYSPT